MSWSQINYASQKPQRNNLVIISDSPNWNQKKRMGNWNMHNDTMKRKLNYKIMSQIIRAEISLTHWGRVRHIYASAKESSLNQIIAWSAPSHYLNQCWDIVNWNLRNKFHEILSQTEAYSFKNMYLKKSSGQWRPFCLGLNLSGLCLIYVIEGNDLSCPPVRYKLQFGDPWRH